jgi:hypothetical protein
VGHTLHSIQKRFRRHAAVLALLALVPDHRDKLPADILADERAGVLHLIDTTHLARVARLAEEALTALSYLIWS